MTPQPTRTVAGTLTGAGAYHLGPAGGRFRWTQHHDIVASAAWREHCWDLYGADDGPAVLSLVAGSVDGHARVALVDHPGRAISTFASADQMTREHIGVVRDGFGETTMVVRADGPTGLHVIATSGEILALTSRRRLPGQGCDVMVTEAGVKAGTTLLFGLSLALELLRAGHLRSVA